MNSLPCIHRSRLLAVAFLFLSHLSVQIIASPSQLEEADDDRIAITRRIERTNSCYEASPTPGCSDPACEEFICQGLFADSCCNRKWDADCVDLAAIAYLGGNCTSDIPEQSNHCFEPDPFWRPGCNNGNSLSADVDAACELVVCARNPACCNDAYDDSCVSLAQELCKSPPPINACVEPSPFPGCKDQNEGKCLEAVCQVDELCCNAKYDFACVAIAREKPACAPQEKPSNSCYETSFYPGCSDRRCQNVVCTLNSFCCKFQFDESCVDFAESICRPVKEDLPVGAKSCPFGMTCSYEEMANCTALADHYNDTLRVGNILGGMYCGGGDLNTIENCPKGSYCPDPETKLPCPAGFYCPYKTQKPTIPCKRCKEGALNLEQELYGWIALGVIAVIVGAYIAWGLLHRHSKRVADHVSQMEKRVNDRLNARKSSGPGNDLILEQLRPKLELISYRLAKLEASQSLAAEGGASSKNFGSKRTHNTKGIGMDGGKITFDPIHVFDVLDADGSGDLTFDELNVILGLSKKELSEFIRRMNEMAASSSSRELGNNTSVTRPVFAKYFLQALTEASKIAISYEETEAMFNELAKGNTSKKEINMKRFYASSMSEFLSDRQILQLTKAFKAIKVDAKAAATNGAGPRNDIRKSLNVLRMSQRRDALGHDVRSMMVSRELFIAHYPDLLMNIMENDDDRTVLEDDSQGVDLCFKNLSLSIKIGKQTIDVVNNVTGRIHGKTMTALMGGSGAGKTSLLNALCGRAHYGETTGTVYINGHETDIENHMDCIGFVPQDDIVYAELTVRENFIYAGRFRLPRGTPDKEIAEYADETIANLGLSRVANSPVGDVKRRGVSGGEKKRVNIGLELMAKPSILFLDEPTSGLDASSALLVMKSLNHLVEKNGVTVVSVIHQPRKFIFDLFDSLILLGVGGQMMYHGPRDEAERYFGRLDYILPKGESVADWLIDISSGRLEPQNPVALKKKENTEDDEFGTEYTGSEKKDSAPLQIGMSSVITDGNCVGKQGVTSGKVVRALKEAKMRREWLCEKWSEYFGKTDGEEKYFFEPPDPYALPSDITKPMFGSQFVNQVKRALIVAWRDRLGKAISSTIIVGSVIFITALDGVTKISEDADPDIPFETLVRPQESEADLIFSQLFAYAKTGQISYPMKVGVILSIIVGLTATSTLTSKRMEFFRESGSGYDMNAYFFAINILSTIEHSIQVTVAAFFATWIRCPIASHASYYSHFLLLAWLTVGWSMFFPMICSPQTVPLVAGFFFAFCGLVFSGAFLPFDYETIYNDGGFKEFLVGWISPTRFFFEAVAVGEYRCLPEQSGFTIETYSAGRNATNTVMRMMGYAGRDLNAVRWSCDGWYWSVGPVIFIGLTVRYVAFGAMHFCFRAQQGKKPLLYVLKRSTALAITILVYCAFLGGLIFITTLLFMKSLAFEDNSRDDYFDIYFENDESD